MSTNDADVNQVRFVDLRVAKGPKFAEYRRQAQQGIDLEQDGALKKASIAGFRINNYSDKEAQIEIVYNVTGADDATGLLAIPMKVVWQNGDWKLSVDGAQPQSTNPASLDGYGTWDSTSATQTSAETGQNLAPVRGRVAPGFDRAVAHSPKPAYRSATTSACPPAMPVCLASKGIKKLVTLPSDVAGDAVGSVAASVGGSAFDAIAKNFVEAQNWVLKKLMTGWMRLPDPDVSSKDSVTTWLDARLSFLVGFIMLGSILIAGYRLAVTGTFQHLADLTSSMVRTVLTIGLIGVAVPIALEAGNVFSAWILQQSNTSTYKNGLAFQGLTNSALLMLFATFIILIQIFQLAIMVIRSGSILYLSAVLALFAAGSNTKTGESSFQKALAWLIAFILYKPVAALIYAGAFQMTANKNVVTQLTGVFMMLLSLLALPAMMRLVVPAVAAVGGSNAGALAGATVGAAVATGAVMATGGASAGFAGASGAGASAGGGGGASAGGAGAVSGGSGPSGATEPPTQPPTQPAPSTTAQGSPGVAGDDSAGGFGGASAGSEATGSSGGTSSGASFSEVSGAMSTGASMGRSSGAVAEGAVDEEDQ